MAQLFGSYIESKRKATWRYLQELQSTAYSLVVFTATMVVMFWASVFLYTSFYFTYMPDESVTWPVNFQYRSCHDRPGICSNPYAVIGVTDPTRGSLLARGQKYRVVVDIDMPESPANHRIGNEDELNVGMFLINMSMKSHAGEVLREASRSSMLRYKSPLLQTISTITFAPLLLYGFQEEKQMVTVELFSQYEEDPVTPLSEVHVELDSRFIQLYNAQLRIHAVFSGLRYIMYHYPLTAAVIGIGICMVFLSAVVIFSWYQFSGPTLNAKIDANRITFPNGNALAVSKDNGDSLNSKDKSMDDSKQQQYRSSRASSGTLTDHDKDKLGGVTGGDANDQLKSGHPAVPGSNESDDFEVVGSSKTSDGAGSRRASRLSVSSMAGGGSRRGSGVYDNDKDYIAVDDKADGRRLSSVSKDDGDYVVRQRIQSVE